jgi:hypothetical protein
VIWLIVNNEEHLLRALADTGASSSIILEAYTSAPNIKKMTVIQPPGVQWVVNLLQLKLGYACDFTLPNFNLKKQISCPMKFHVDDRSESSSTYDMIIGKQPRSPWKIRHNHELQ